MTAFNLIPVKHVAVINRAVLPEATPPETRIRYLDIGSVGRGVLVKEPERLAFAHAPSRARRVTVPGDVLVSTVRTYLRAGAQVRPEDGGVITSTGFATLSPTPAVDSRFLFYATSADVFVEEVVARSVGVSYPAIAPSELAAVPIPVPPLPVQRRIADYLDTETSRIDTLIEKNVALSDVSRERLHRRMVEGTLGRPRDVVAHDLTDAFGGVFAPVHALARVGTGHTPSRNVAEYWQDCDIPWLNIPDLAEARGFWIDEVTTTAEHLNTAGLANSAAVLCPAGTVFVTRTASIGHSVLNAVPMATNQRLVTYQTDPRRLNPRFLLWSIRALKLIGHFDRLTFGATHDTIYYDDMVGLRVPVRDLADQRAAVASIEELRDEVAELRDRLGSASRLLAERRQALISAVVTGAVEA